MLPNYDKKPTYNYPRSSKTFSSFFAGKGKKHCWMTQRQRHHARDTASPRQGLSLSLSLSPSPSRALPLSHSRALALSLSLALALALALALSLSLSLSLQTCLSIY